MSDEVAAEEVGEETEGGYQHPDISNIEFGYVVGVNSEGNFVFELLGEHIGLVQLLGVHTHAGVRVNSIHEKQLMFGDALVNELNHGLRIVNNKIDRVLSEIQVPVSNKLKQG